MKDSYSFLKNNNFFDRIVKALDLTFIDLKLEYYQIHIANRDVK